MSVVIGVLLFLLSPFAMLAGLISVIYPLRFFRIYSRRMALGVMAASLAMFITGVAMVRMGTEDHPQPLQQQATADLPKPIMNDGCNFAGAIPDCKEEVARLVAKQAALPPRPITPSARSSSSNRVMEWLQEEENRIKAAEASANVKRLDAERELDKAQFDENVARANLDKVDRESESRLRQTQQEVDRTGYNLRVEERNLERLQRERAEASDRELHEALQRGRITPHDR
jgi:hypothetical protein